MSAAGKYDDMLADEVEREVEKRKLEVTEGSGKDGRVIKADMVAALVADDADVVEDEAGDAPEPMEAVEEDLADEVEDVASVEVGAIVDYRDRFGGTAKEARISRVADADEGVVDLAVFSKAAGASRTVAGVPRGAGAGHWSPRGAA